MKEKKFKFGLLTLMSMMLVISCTDLEIEPTDSVIENLTGEFSGVGDVDAAITNVYNALNGQIGNQADLYALNEVTSDELLVPTRGTDWGDNGLWRNLHEHTWSAIHPFVLNNWNNLNTNIFNTTEIIDSRSGADAGQLAQAKFLRAFSMFWIMDMYGQVPFREPDEGPEIDPRVFTRAEALDFVVTDLNEAIPDLPVVGPSASTNRASRAAGNYLLAKVLLNKHIYNGSGTPAAADMTSVVEAVDAITADGFALQAGYFGIFTSDVDTETILFAETSVGNRMWNGLHYNQNSPDNGGGGWNGWSTLAEFYDLFEGDPNTNVPGSGQEERRGFVPTDGSNLGIGFGFLVGQQYDASGNMLTDRPGQPLEFTRDFPGLLGNNERTGIRTIKYHPENGAFANHEIVFRYADAHLMKVEAIFRGGTSGDDPLTLINDLRTIRNAANPITTLTEQDLLDERGRELYKEFWRRNDQIRFGKFAETWGLKSSTEEFRALFPIPSGALISNPNLTQNPGY
ncbi:RagB/SusD family nutrient uptake outer membrane protein [Aquimarina sp. 2201CG14-23]|uniref:RagB/SusD family nutrient uptake outer membrane protein n=1 Tax=Aquimarina mycalae TaxID=3040073 RepID=UPI002477EF5A|nr:RagB/SusD family nutrient uptake outer membrane protein [Aquimarina sp. 2201CG14-23]MDH7447932.1 RagB/SusD family nutrient uptake outer membrane protein [Aquimarina sp. 2201CG14-23]